MWVLFLLVIHKPARAFLASKHLAAFAKDHAPQVPSKICGGFPLLILNSDCVQQTLQANRGGFNRITLVNFGQIQLLPNGRKMLNHFLHGGAQ
jgi:hypothetical protein